MHQLLIDAVNKNNFKRKLYINACSNQKWHLS